MTGSVSCSPLCTENHPASLRCLVSAATGSWVESSGTTQTRSSPRGACGQLEGTNRKAHQQRAGTQVCTGAVRVRRAPGR